MVEASVTPAGILAFWRDAGPDRWYRRDDAFDAEVRAFCRANLTGYKQPRVIEFRSDLPKTPVGKILRRELRDAQK